MWEPIPEDVREFLRSSIASVEQLEILRVLSEAPRREWRDHEIRRKAQVCETAIQRELQVLEGREILRCRCSGSQRFCQYAPATPELETNVGRVLEFYRQRPVTTIRLIYEQRARG